MRVEGGPPLALGETPPRPSEATAGFLLSFTLAPTRIAKHSWVNSSRTLSMRDEATAGSGS
jgi:hypothetical protein